MTIKLAHNINWFLCLASRLWKVIIVFAGNLRGPNVGVTSPDSAGESKSVCSLQSNNSRCSHWIWRMENQPGVYNGGCTTTERPRTRREASDGRQEASQASWSQASARPGPEVHGLLVFEKPFKVWWTGFHWIIFDLVLLQETLYRSGGMETIWFLHSLHNNG